MTSDLAMAINDQFKARRIGKWPQRAMMEHLQYLRDLTMMLDAQQIVEFGVHSGQSTIAFLAGLVETGGRLWSCDRDRPRKPIADFVDEVPFWEFVQASDIDAIEEVPAPIDILLLDASAGYYAVVWRLEQLAPLVRPGGTILAHDVEIADKARAINDWLADNAGYDYHEERAGRHPLAVIHKEDV